MTEENRILNTVSHVSRWLGILIVAILPLFLWSCASLHESEDFQRHRTSQLVVPYDRKDIFYYDVTITAAYPDNDPDAEAQRIEWLEEWIEQRKLCPSGYEILNRRAFDFMEDNPARHDLRYEVSCISAAAESTTE